MYLQPDLSAALKPTHLVKALGVIQDNYVSVPAGARLARPLVARTSWVAQASNAVSTEHGHRPLGLRPPETQSRRLPRPGSFNTARARRLQKGFRVPLDKNNEQTNSATDTPARDPRRGDLRSGALARRLARGRDPGARAPRLEGAPPAPVRSRGLPAHPPGPSPGPSGGLRGPPQAQRCRREQDPPEGFRGGGGKREAARPHAGVRSWVPAPGSIARRRRRRQPPLLPAARTNQSPLRGTGK